MKTPGMPDKIGRYKLTGELGRGGMGVVYLARDPFIGRAVAIKTTLTPPPKDPEKLERFYHAFFREAQAAGMLAHPNIVYVHDASVETDRCYLVMEYVDGPTLKEYCHKDSLLPVSTVVNIIYQCAKGLDYAHKKGVIHRDIKPTNIMLAENDTAKITDFGIAAIEGPTGLGGPGTSTFSLYYSSPEQIQRKDLNNQTDIFSLGVVMYELLTGAKPFMGETEVGTFFKIATEDPKPLRELRPELPESLERIAAKALAKNPADRYKNAQKLAWDLTANFEFLKSVADETNMEEKHHALKRIDFFKDFNPNELDEIIDVTQWVTFDDGSAIIAEGAVEDSFYIIIAGGVQVRKGEKTLAALKTGDCFGEMAYVGKTARTADVYAVGHTVLLRVNPTVIDNTSTTTQLRFFKVFTGVLIKRLTETSRLLAQSS